MDGVSKVISAIVPSEATLEQLIDQLEREVVGRHQISIQGSPEELAKKFNTGYIAPEIIQGSDNPPTKEPFLLDDFGWLIGFSMAIPIFICAVIGFLIFGEPQSDQNYFLSSAIGILIGTMLGAFIGIAVVKRIKQHRNMRICKQEQQGGFVLWITAMSAEQSTQIVSILQKYHAKHILIN